MIPRVPLLLLLLTGLGALLTPGPAGAQTPFGEQVYEYELSDVLPLASVFDRVDDHWRGYATEGRDEVVGYVFLTDDLVDIPGYSGETLNTLIGMNVEGTITGIKIVRHSEPIVLIGLDESAIHDFTRQYTGKQVTDRILISDEPEEGYVVVDAISGATVTAVAENATILEASRLVGRREGIVSAAQVRTQRPSPAFQPLSWNQLESTGAVGAIAVTPQEAKQRSGGRSVDVRFALVDPPSIGRNLLGDRFYDIVRARLARDGGSAFYIGGRGDLSFKGPGFARGGIFDRFVIEQAGDLFVFKDLDYIAHPVLASAGAPHFREGGVFFTRDSFDPTAPFTFRLTVPFRLHDERNYATFVTDYELPGRFIESDTPFWLSRWQASWLAVLFTAAFLAITTVAFALRLRLLPRRKLLHRSMAVLAAIVLGVVLKAQPSTTQILTLAGSLRHLEFPSEIFLSEPLIFMLWIVTAITLVVWGRGFFCGWVCPYGALLEALIAVWERVAPAGLLTRLKAWDPPPWVRYGKIAAFLVILAVSLVSLPMAEAIDEIEPFKTFVLRLARPSTFVAYFVVMTLLSVVIHRFFCRFVCPLGGALAIPSAKAPLFPLFRYQTCTTCKICAKGCEPKAISFETGRIDYQECLQCWDCQATGTNEAVCPELIVARRQNRPARFLAAGLVTIALLWPHGATADTRVGPDTIGAALAAARPGDTLVLEPGVYRGPLHIERSVTVVGTDGAVVDAGGIGHGVIVDAPGVVVQGLTIRNCRITNEFSDSGVWIEQSAVGARVSRNRIEQCRFGIWVNGTAQAEVADNHVVGIEALSANERGDCIHLWDADGTRVAGNVLMYCRDGIYLELTNAGLLERNEISRSRYAIHTMWCDRSRYVENYAHDNLVGLALMFSTQIEAIRNTAHNNRAHGLLWIQVTRGLAEGNIAIGNTKGLFIYNSLYNTIRGNLVARNNLGAHYWGGSQENLVEDNAFIENEIQLKFVGSKDQTWDSNYWSDYGGWDADDDGHGDRPYHSNTLVDALLWEHPASKLLLTSPAFQLLAFAEREFPVITAPKVIDPSPQMAPVMERWAAVLEHYPANPQLYYMAMQKLPHMPGDRP